MKDIKALISEMTLEEKAGLCSGYDFWHTKEIKRLNIPGLMMCDGPHGLRKQNDKADHLGINESIKAVCFPAGCALASSFSREIARMLGETLGEEGQAENVSTILGPAMNIKRSPLCGRNFEYYSEDPLLAGEIAASYVNGVQSKNVATSPKHFMANSQEYHRMTCDSVMDDRTMREIYLAAFERMVKASKPWTIMNSYNKLNGTYLCENEKLLTDILRDEWGFDGFVVTDWGAMNERVDALRAGCELEMPSSNGMNDAKIIKAVKDGQLNEKILDNSCERILNILFRYVENRDDKQTFDYDGHHEIARKIEEESIVLLKNEDNILPLNRDDYKTDRTIAYIGKYAKKPRYQGGGSSHINSYKIESALEMGNVENILYAQGFDDAADEIDEELILEAVKTAETADAAVLFVGLPDSFESEGYDRSHLRMPECQNYLITEVAKVQSNIIVVLHNGAPVEMPWVDKVKGIVEVYLGGQAVGGAVDSVLYGDVCPSGRLAETFPIKLKDTPSYLWFGGEKNVCEYKEGVFVGYRYYESKDIPVLFPFGYGLSYTTFEYSNLQVSSDELVNDKSEICVSVDVKNTGKCIGKEVVQLYVSHPKGKIIRPIRELRGFEKIEIMPDETRTVKFVLDKRAFAYWDMNLEDWNVENGTCTIEIGKSVRDIVLTKEVDIKAEIKRKRIYNRNTTFGELVEDGKTDVFEKVMESFGMGDFGAPEAGGDDEAINDQMQNAMMEGMPLRQMVGFLPVAKEEILDKLIEELNSTMS